MTITTLRRARLLVGTGAATLALVVPLAGTASAHSGQDGGQDPRGAVGNGPSDPTGRGLGGNGWRSDPNGTGGGARTIAWPWGWKGQGDPKQPSGPQLEKQPKPTTPTTTDPNATDVQVAALQRRCTVAIDRRLGQLGALTSRVTAAPNLTDADEAALAGIVSSASTGLGQLKTTIAADTDLATLQGHCRGIVTGYLVYASVMPQVHVVIAADNVAAAADRLDQVAAKLVDAIAAAKAAGKDTSAAEAKPADMQQEIAAGRAAVAGVADPVLALTPSSPARSPVCSARPGRRSARRRLTWPPLVVTPLRLPRPSGTPASTMTTRGRRPATWAGSPASASSESRGAAAERGGGHSWPGVTTALFASQGTGWPQPSLT